MQEINQIQLIPEKYTITLSKLEYMLLELELTDRLLDINNTDLKNTIKLLDIIDKNRRITYKKYKTSSIRQNILCN